MLRDGGTPSEVAPSGEVPHHSGSGKRDLAERPALPRRLAGEHQCRQERDSGRDTANAKDTYGGRRRKTGERRRN